MLNLFALLRSRGLVLGGERCGGKEQRDSTSGRNDAFHGYLFGIIGPAPRFGHDAALEADFGGRTRRSFMSAPTLPLGTRLLTA